MPQWTTYENYLDSKKDNPDHKAFDPYVPYDLNDIAQPDADSVPRQRPSNTIELNPNYIDDNGDADLAYLKRQVAQIRTQERWAQTGATGFWPGDMDIRNALNPRSLAAREARKNR
jgi:hypothetical protein